MPAEAQWQELLTIHGDFPASWMIWEDTPLPQMRERLESMGIRSVVFDPCANTPPSGDFLSVMGKNLRALRFVFAAERQRVEVLAADTERADHRIVHAQSLGSAGIHPVHEHQ